MSVIGSLKPTIQNSTDEYVGHIVSLDLDLSLRLIPNEQSNSDKAPSHLILCKSNTGREIQIGSAWTKTIQTGNRYGDQFLSLTLDDPSFSNPLNVAAFKADGRDHWDITWRRRQDGNSKENQD